ncbi:DUF6064 family protein [Oligoflexus tunisiensis]|uniref:DUF6064 family protein n=1 Tax=Oligoflexus tunisiensis TaxID=708132 RepID=UPI00114C8A56|nr:DUF6064 family protein [Oligoflexus tunisiensis]
MGEWSTYRITDFILFSKEILFEVFAAYNHDFWPWQLLWLALAFVILGLLFFRTRHRSRIISGIMAAAWAWVGLIFHLKYFQPINWAARSFAWLFLAESLLIFFCGVILGKLEPGTASGIRQLVGVGLYVLAAFIPIELMFGQSPDQILIFGWGPERTALGTIGLLLTGRPGALNLILMIVPLIWCLIASLVYYGLAGVT